MNCPEKEMLQSKCITAWDAYAAMVKECALSIETESGTVTPLSISELLALSRFGADAKPGTKWFAAAYSAALRLRGDHLKACRALSRHLAGHRC
jgi:hypothetical protein